LAYIREYENDKILIVNNLSSKKQEINHPMDDNDLAVLFLNGFIMNDNASTMVFEPYGFAWFLVL